MPARPRALTSTLLTAALAGGLLSGCGGAGADHSFAGQPVVELEQSLSSIEGTWRQEITNSDTKTRLAEDAHCFFQVDPQETEGKTPIGQSVLCGPYRKMGAEKTAWDVADVTAYPYDDKGNLTVSLAPSGSGKLFRQGEPSPNLTPWRPDGAEADLAAEVPEPDAPVAEAGTVIELYNPGDLTAARDELRTPFASYTVQRGVQPRVNGPDGRLAAPEGGTFVIYAISGQMGYGGETEAPTFAVTAGEESYSLPGTNGTWALALPGDGSDAQLEMDYDGLTQTLDAHGVRADNATAAPLYTEGENRRTLTVGSLRDEQGDYSSEGWSGRVDSGWSGPTAQLVPYTPAQGWAPEGKVWLLLEGSVSASGINHRSGDTYGNYDLQKVEVTGIAVDGTPVEGPTTTSDRSSAGYTAATPVDAATQEFTLAIDVHVTALRSSYSDSSLPERGELDFTLEAPVTQ